MDKSEDIFTYICVNENTKEIFKLREHALIGISPFNSYFTYENIEKLILWGLKNFKEIGVFIPDEISAFTFRALGYPETRIKVKVKKQDLYLKNKILKVFNKVGFSKEEIDSKVFYLSKIKATNKAYLEVYEICLKLFEDNIIFRDACVAVSRSVLSKTIKGENSNPAMEIGVQYFLAELPIFLDTPGILGISSSSFVYKEIPEFLEIVYKIACEVNIFASSNQYFLQTQ